jgi:hypothetical protein
MPGQHTAECPRCGCEFDPLIIYSIQEVADKLHVRPRTVMGWQVQGRLKYRIRPINGWQHKRIIMLVDVMKFLDTHWPDPLVDPQGETLAHRSWRRAHNAASVASRAASKAREAKRLAQGPKPSE